MGLRIATLGGRQVFARVRDADGRLVAVARLFPRHGRAAVRQKARWMTGIALAGWDRIGWGRARDWRDHWMRMRDRRAPLAVFVLVVAYVALLAWGASLALHALAGDRRAAAERGDDDVAHDQRARCWLWRLAMRALVHRARLWLAARRCWSLPRAFVGNFIALLAARSAIVALCRACCAADAPHWDKTRTRLPRERVDARVTRRGRPLRFSRRGRRSAWVARARRSCCGRPWSSGDSSRAGAPPPFADDARDAGDTVPEPVPRRALSFATVLASRATARRRLAPAAVSPPTVPRDRCASRIADRSPLRPPDPTSRSSADPGRRRAAHRRQRDSRRRVDRWSASAWLRRCAAAAASRRGVVGGQLGGSPGGRADRLYARPTRAAIALVGARRDAARARVREAAIGVEWQPTRAAGPPRRRTAHRARRRRGGPAAGDHRRRRAGAARAGASTSKAMARPA